MSQHFSFIFVTRLNDVSHLMYLSVQQLYLFHSI